MADSSQFYHDVSPSVRIAYTLNQPTNPPASPRPTVILINGLADTKETWAPQVTGFTAAGYRVLTFDNRGVGASSRPSQRPNEVYTTTTAEMADDLASLITAVGIKGQTHILGLSMGGMIAQSFALEHILGHPIPGLEVLSVTFSCTFAAPGPFCTRMFELWRDVALKMSVETAMREVVLWCFSPEFFADPAGQQVIEALDEDMKTIDDESSGGMGLTSYLAQLHAILEFDSRKEIGALGQHSGDGADTALPQIIVLAGESDVLIPVSSSRELHGLIPSAIWRTTKGGHSCNWEFADQYNKTCLDAWKEIEDSR
jgi:3-oxoadipate enol-lactonase